MHIVGWVAAIFLAAFAGFNVHYALVIAGANPEGAFECLFTSVVMAVAALGILWVTPARPRAEPDATNQERTTCPP